jgi:hypothetical protein
VPPVAKGVVVTELVQFAWQLAFCPQLSKQEVLL